MRNFFLRFLPIVIVASLLVSCRDEGVDGEVEIALMDIVTFTGNRDGRAEFTFVKVDDTPEITLTGDCALDVEKDRIPGRMLIRYIPESGKAYESGPVTLLGASLINFSPVETEWRKEYDSWDHDGVYLYSIWRSASIVNIHVRLTYTAEPRLFKMAVDPATLDSSVPDIYLVHQLPDGTDSHDRAYYASFDLSPVWDRPRVTGVRIHLSNTNLDKHIFTFYKTVAPAQSPNLLTDSGNR